MTSTRLPPAEFREATPHHSPAQPLLKPDTANLYNTSVAACDVTGHGSVVVLDVPQQNLLPDILKLCLNPVHEASNFPSKIG